MRRPRWLPKDAKPVVYEVYKPNIWPAVGEGWLFEDPERTFVFTEPRFALCIPSPNNRGEITVPFG